MEAGRERANAVCKSADSDTSLTPWKYMLCVHLNAFATQEGARQFHDTSLPI